MGTSCLPRRGFLLRDVGDEDEPQTGQNLQAENLDPDLTSLRKVCERGTPRTVYIRG